MDNEVKDWLKKTVPVVQSLERRVAESYWQAATTGDSRYEEEYTTALGGLRRFYADPQFFSRLQSFRESSIEDAQLRRQLDVLYMEAAMVQMPEEDIKAITELEAQIEIIFTHHRAEFRGTPMTDNELKEILKNETDTYKRKDAWKASKQIGKRVAPLLRELVKRRNQVAQTQGYQDYYEMALKLNELDEGFLFSLLEDLKIQTDQLFADLKKELDKQVADRFGLLPEGVRPWHYVDPFFQEAPPVFTQEMALDAHFEGCSLEELAIRTFREIGLFVEEMLDRSDLYERKGKSQHAFCLDIDREGDVRVLCNLRGNGYWMGTLLHELGHAVYDRYHNQSLPYLLRKPAHIAATEAVAMLMGRLVRDPEWLTKVAGFPKDQMEAGKEALQKQTALDMLVFLRWCLVMVHFERELYRNPDGDLNTRWWDMVEQYQFVPRPETRNAPDWAAKIHLGTAPVYYQNYLLGELMASQIFQAMQKETGAEGHPLVNNPDAGAFLRERIFHQGATMPWGEMLKMATGSKLTANHFIQQFVPEPAKAEKPRRVPRKKADK
jgi:peptidyl-dipeptidase A